ncbi:MAG: LLM class flavin-dependent oxidoreductase [Candidatus Rokuibacteriota bacterium]|nr:MAG: LLM class flavin-dependent oxidoreductase [Candidatus Rokubacteria bacterium]PYO05552.1 MAG: LLM class flavin-dependent oxidoreductase [Candidatus Rokubacteria bacterium]
MKFMLFILPTVPGTLEDRKRLRPIGRNTERYQQMLDEMRKLAVLADDAGFDVFATTEHHFHSEGYETSVAPLLLYADLAARTRRIKFAPLGLVLPAWDPIRAAEELAVLDQLTKGRLYAGFARGYQDRWVNVLGQQYHVTGAPMDGSAIDQHNRKVYEEAVKVIKKSWMEETWEYNGQYYKVPFPYEEGIRRWPAAEWTRNYGAPGEVDEQGVIRKICVVPRPYQDPHPTLFQPFSVSENTIRYTAREGIVPWILTSYPPAFKDLCRVYREVAAENGRQLGLGESVGAFRAVHFGRTEDEAVELFRTTNYAGFHDYFYGFGFAEAFRVPDDNTKYPLDPYTALPLEELTVERLRRVKYALAGTPEQVRAEIEAVQSVYDGGKLEWFGWFFDQGFMPWDEEVRQIELFAKHIIPYFR